MTAQGRGMRPILEFLLVIALTLFPAAAGVLAFMVGAPWWVAIAVSAVLYWFVNRGFSGAVTVTRKVRLP